MSKEDTAGEPKPRGEVFSFNEAPESACPFEGEPVQAAKYWKMLCGGMPDCRPTGIAYEGIIVHSVKDVANRMNFRYGLFPGDGWYLPQWTPG
ncbi:hypothetical protein PG1C_09880 [Rugosibacter aromaticivorans]|uniref:Uncharacterized protein n=1 Tax=Rugosibacter aromaticivorans TaxID=1565605 RepID=A0A0C5J9Q8_9PROT|nr:hypothetical protein PG1C_09880 [Rugosibacter aromaticivorans]